VDSSFSGCDENKAGYHYFNLRLLKGKETKMSEFMKVARLGEIAVGQGKLVETGGKEIALFNVGGAIHAIDNSCTHVGGPLCEGELDGTEVTCPWHGAIFDVTTGAVLGPPATSPISRYSVRIEGSDIEVEI
jgi:nitrite reductase/ring-hydroxylating ferredoxin subunit